MCKEEIFHIETMQKKIIYIETIINHYGSVLKALEDEALGKPAILMHLVAIAEQMEKLHKKSSNLLNFFRPDDIKGCYAVRNFIAHDYNFVKISVIETLLEHDIPRLKSVIEKILQHRSSDV